MTVYLCIRQGSKINDDSVSVEELDWSAGRQVLIPAEHFWCDFKWSKNSSPNTNDLYIHYMDKSTGTPPSLEEKKICRIPSLNTQHLEPWSRWATAAEDHTGCRSWQLRTENRDYNSHRNTKIEQWKIVKTLPGLMSLDFCCDIQMIGSEFGVKDMKAWIHPALFQRFMLVVV